MSDAMTNSQVRARIAEQLAELDELRSIASSGPSTVPATAVVAALDLAVVMGDLASLALAERS